MPRFRMTIEYDGSNYVGWQRQDNGPSVQGAVEKAILALTREPALIRGAGRTDSGVHAPWPGGACGSFARLEAGDVAQCTERLSRPGWTTGVDSSRRRMCRMISMPAFSALRRHYLYRIISRPSPLALEAKRAWWVSKKLDHEAMHAAAQTLVGYHDFTTFRSHALPGQQPVADARPAGCDAQ